MPLIINALLIYVPAVHSTKLSRKIFVMKGKVIEVDLAFDFECASKGRQLCSACHAPTQFPNTHPQVRLQARNPSSQTRKGVSPSLCKNRVPHKQTFNFLQIAPAANNPPGHSHPSPLRNLLCVPASLSLCVTRPPSDRISLAVTISLFGYFVYFVVQNPFPIS